MAHVDLPTVCPQCGNPTTAPLTSGFRLCPSCSLEWDPADPPQFDPPPAEVVEAAEQAFVPYVVDDDDDDDDDEPAPLDTVPLEGTDVILVDGRTATVLDFPTESTMLVELADGDQVEVDFNDVRGSADITPAVVASDDQQEQMGRTALMLAGMTLEAAVAALTPVEGGERAIAVPPTGWSPPDADVLPLVEMGAAYAVATLAVLYGIPNDTLQEHAQRLLRDAQQTETETVEGTDNDQ